MKQLSIVCWDDDIDEARRIAQALKSEWVRNCPLVPCEFKITDDFNVYTIGTLIRELDANLFVSDILRGKPKEDRRKDGLELIKSIRDWSDQLVHGLAILAVSWDSGPLRDQAIQVGADEFIAKEWILQNRGDRVHNEILSILKKRGHEPNPYDEDVLEPALADDLPLISAIETIGREPIVFFASQLMRGRCTGIKAAYLKGGLSGATVLSLDCTLATAPGQPSERARPLLVKIAQDKALINREVSKAADIESFHELFVPIYAKPPMSFGEWWALGSKFQRGAKTLHDWLTKDQPTEAEVKGAFSGLFLNGGLASTYAGATERPEQPFVEFRRILTVGRAAKVQLAMEDLRLVIDRHVPKGDYDSLALNQFLVDPSKIGKAESLRAPKSVWVAKQHGDLHGRNILYTPSHGLRLIDPANIDTFHWAADPARLSVDLMCSSWDAGPLSHEWDAMNSWIETTRAFIQGAEFQASDKNEAVGKSIQWIRNNVSTICQKTAHPFRTWEFYCVLAIEFLRCAYRSADLSTPKRVLALVGATHALRLGEASLEDPVRLAT